MLPFISLIVLGLVIKDMYDQSQQSDLQDAQQPQPQEGSKKTPTITRQPVPGYNQGLAASGAPQGGDLLGALSDLYTSSVQPKNVQEAPLYERDTDGSLRITPQGRTLLGTILNGFHNAKDLQTATDYTLYPDRDYGESYANEMNGSAVINTTANSGSIPFIEKNVLDLLNVTRDGSTISHIYVYTVKPSSKSGWLKQSLTVDGSNIDTMVAAAQPVG